MLDLYFWPTPNGHKVTILLEELDLPYTVHALDIGAGDQFAPEFLKISPNNKMPALVDSEGPEGRPYALFESGAILMYLAEKHGRFWPQAGEAKWEVVKWLMFQMGAIGPMFGQAHHFRRDAPKGEEYGIARYTNEAGRLYRVMDKRLAEFAFLAGDDYTIADIATFPWSRTIERKGHSFDDFPNVKRWVDEVAARPAVVRGLKVLADRRSSAFEGKQREVLFGAVQYASR